MKYDIRWLRYHLGTWLLGDMGRHPFSIKGCFRCGKPITYDLYCDEHQVIDPKIREEDSKPLISSIR